MCNEIIVYDKSIMTVGELKDVFKGIEIVKSFDYENIEDDACLCQIDIPKTLSGFGIEFESDGYNFTIKEI